MGAVSSNENRMRALVETGVAITSRLEVGSGPDAGTTIAAEVRVQ